MTIMLVLNPFKSSLVLLQTRKYSSIFIIMLKLFVFYLALVAAYLRTWDDACSQHCDYLIFFICCYLTLMPMKTALSLLMYRIIKFNLCSRYLLQPHYTQPNWCHLFWLPRELLRASLIFIHDYANTIFYYLFHASLFLSIEKYLNLN